jgi:hypothetical protein
MLLQYSFSYAVKENRINIIALCFMSDTTQYCMSRKLQKINNRIVSGQIAQL